MGKVQNFILPGFSIQSEGETEIICIHSLEARALRMNYRHMVDIAPADGTRKGGR